MRRPGRRRRDRQRARAGRARRRSCSTARRSTPSPAARSPTRASSPPTACTLEVRRRAAPGQGPARAHRRGASAGRCAPARRVHAEVDPEWRLSASPGALRHPRRARGAAPGARPVGPAVRLLQPARLPAARLRLGLGALAGHPQRDRGGRQPRRAQRPPGVGDRTCRCRRPARSVRWRCSARPTTRTCGSSRSVARGRRELCGGTHVAALQPDRRPHRDRRVVGRVGRAPRRGVRRHRGAALPREGARDRRPS